MTFYVFVYYSVKCYLLNIVLARYILARQCQCAISPVNQQPEAARFIVLHTHIMTKMIFHIHSSLHLGPTACSRNDMSHSIGHQVTQLFLMMTKCRLPALITIRVRDKRLKTFQTTTSNLFSNIQPVMSGLQYC